MKLQKCVLLVHIVIIMQAADRPKIVLYNSNRDVDAVTKMMSADYQDIICRSDSCVEQQRYIIELLNCYKECENETIAGNRDSFKKQFVMLYNQQTMGFISIIFNRPLTLFGVPTGSIRALAVDQRYRGNGYGADLCNYACNVLKEHGAHKVSVMTTSQDVYHTFYNKLGFKPSAIGSVGKFDPTFFYNKRLVQPQSWSTWGLCVLRRFKR